MTKGIEHAEFNLIFEMYYDVIRNYLYYRVMNIDVAEDLAQDVFVSLWNKRKTIDKETVKSYIYKIASNKSINYLKHKKIVGNYALNLYLKKEVETQSPEFELQKKELEKMLNDALAKLSPDLRVTFLMNRIDNLTYAEIAERFGISVKAVEKRMSKALKELRKIIKNI